MKKKEITKAMVYAKSYITQIGNHKIEGFPIGVSKWQVFLSIKPLIKGKKYWYALRTAYENSDNLYSFRHDVLLAFLKNEPEKEYLMNAAEKRFLNSLPEQITIYRGMTTKEFKEKSFGPSWTLKKEVAEFFAHEYKRNYDTSNMKKIVHKITINKSEVVAFFNGRKEFEIIYIDKNNPIHSVRKLLYRTEQ
jgi:hypothetical protein